MPRGRPKGSKNKSKQEKIVQDVPVAKKRGRPAGSTNKSKVTPEHKRPVDNTNKPKESAPVKRRGRPVGSKNIPQPDVPKVTYTVEPIRGFMEIMSRWGDRGYMVYQVSSTSMELKAEDMPKAVQKYADHFGKLPTRAILHERNEKLLPYLNAQAPDIEIGLVMGGTALWEMQLQVP